MCLALPGEIIKFVDENNALVKFGGSEIQINLSFVENAKVGDYVIAHSGFALSLLDTEEAEKTFSVWREYEESLEES
jgi:hydrogenase expression/formation protein HypC